MTLRPPADSDSFGNPGVIPQSVLTASGPTRTIFKEDAVRLPGSKPERQREVSPLAMYRAGRVDWPGPEVTPLELYGAQVAPDFAGHWVYAFADPGPGRVWYAGQTRNLWSRWTEHNLKYGERFRAAVKWVIPVPNEAVADLKELVLINFYEPECNDKGRAADLAAKVRKWSRGTKEFQPNGARWGQEGLDYSQGTH
jgi:predicted GIY-YIG superfamily endonuclease